VTLLLDTTTVSALLRRVPGVVRRIDVYLHGPQLAICVNTRGELLYGFERLPAGRKRESLAKELEVCFSQIPCVPTPETAGDQYARLRHEADSRGTPMGHNDLWIAATALALDATLVTTDSDFAQCQGLRIED